VNSALRVLIVEDSEADAKLVAHEIGRAGHAVEFERVDDAPAMRAALTRSRWDLVISDWSMPHFSALAALAILKEAGLDIPLIIVSGSIGEESVVEALRSGAHDFMLKGKLARLVPAVERGVRQAQGRKARREAERALHAIDARYRRIVEATTQGAWILDAQAKTTFVSPRMALMLGSEPSELLGRPLSELVAPESRSVIERQLAERRRGKAAQYEARFLRKDGSALWMLIEASPIYGDAGQFEGSLGMALDISEWKRADEALRASEEQVRLLIDSTEEAIYGIDLDGRCTFANAACLRILGCRDRSELLGKSMHALIHHTKKDGTPYPLEECQIYQAGLRGDGAALDDEVLWRLDGTRFAAEHRSFPLWRGGKRVGAVISFVDISARKAAEETLRRLAAIVETSADGIIGTDPNGVIMSWNPGAERIYGYSAREVIGRNISLIAPPGSSGDAGRFIERLHGGKSVQDHETVGFRKDGSRIDVSLTLSLMRDAAGTIQGISGIARDITERRVAAEQVRLLHDIALGASQATNLEETFDVVLGLICLATGFPLAEAWVPGSKGRLERRGHWARPEDRESFELFMEGGSLEPGSGLPGRVWSSREPAWIAQIAEDDDFPRAALAKELGIRAGVAVPVLAGDELVGVIDMFLHEPRERDPQLLRLLSTVGAQIGSLVQRRQAEEALRRSEEQLRQVQKMEAIGQLTSGIAHDFNNMLAVVLSSASFLLRGLDKADPRREDVEEITLAAERAASLTRQLLAFSRKQVLEPRLLDLSAVVGNLEKMLRRLVGEHIELATVLPTDLGTVKADAGQMEQVIINLVVNARDAMRGGGKLRLETANVELDSSYPHKRAFVQPGNYVLLAVSDTGTGMDAATQQRIFEPFFTTKEKGKGTGLGLSTCYGIVKQSGGYILVYSEPGHGTVFKVYLPRVSDVPQTLTVSHETPVPLSGSERILLVEDDDRVRAVAKKILEANGYRVLAAPQGRDALAFVAGLDGRLDLVLSDIILPGLSGPELVAHIRERHPTIKVLFMSGYMDHSMLKPGAIDPAMHLIQKPFTPETLARKVREVLDG
jgi:PAS domain S-box-containing protein